MPSRRNITAPKPADTTVIVTPAADIAALFDKHIGPLAQPKGPGEFTVGEAARLRKISPKRAATLLTDLMQRGILKRRPGRRNEYLYRFVDGERSE